MDTGTASQHCSPAVNTHRNRFSASPHKNPEPKALPYASVISTVTSPVLYSYKLRLHDLGSPATFLCVPSFLHSRTTYLLSTVYRSPLCTSRATETCSHRQCSYLREFWTFSSFVTERDRSESRMNAHSGTRGIRYLF